MSSPLHRVSWLVRVPSWAVLVAVAGCEATALGVGSLRAVEETVDADEPRTEGAAIEEGAAVEGAAVEGAGVEGAAVEGAAVEGAAVEGAAVEGADVEGADVEGADVEGADVEGADVEGADVEGQPVHEEGEASDETQVCDVADVQGEPSADSWFDSYSANGRCYCASSFDHDIGSIVVDTPHGPRTVLQVCTAIGPGPGRDGHPVYNDIQCGHGPANDAGDEDWCPGRVDQGAGGCCTAGPRWSFVDVAL